MKTAGRKAVLIFAGALGAALASPVRAALDIGTPPSPAPKP